MWLIHSFEYKKKLMVEFRLSKCGHDENIHLLRFTRSECSEKHITTHNNVLYALLVILQLHTGLRSLLFKSWCTLASHVNIFPSCPTVLYLMIFGGIFRFFLDAAVCLGVLGNWGPSHNVCTLANSSNHEPYLIGNQEPLSCWMTCDSYSFLPVCLVANFLACSQPWWGK